METCYLPNAVVPECWVFLLAPAFFGGYIFATGTMMPNQADISKTILVRRIHSLRGFTMVELIAVLIIGGILAAFVTSRFVQNETFDARSFTDQNLTMLRYAQKLAIAQNRPVFVLLNSGPITGSIALCFNAACGAADRVLAPAGKNSGSKATLAACGTDSAWFCEGRPNNVTYTLPTVTVFYFNALGRPFVAGNIEPLSSFTRLEIAISGGGTTRTIVVEAETGYVHL